MRSSRSGDGTREAAADLQGPPVVGRTYLVPTVRHRWHGVSGTWPVMGPRHEDPELNFPWRHHHVDARFLTPAQARTVRRVYGRMVDASGRAPVAEGDLLALAVAASPLREELGETMAEAVARPRVCVATGHDYPVGRSLGLPTFARLHEAHAGRRCARDAAGRLVCPHKGFVLDSLAPDAGGRVTCPLHGLVVDLASGTVVGRDAGDLGGAP